MIAATLTAPIGPRRVAAGIRWGRSTRPRWRIAEGLAAALALSRGTPEVPLAQLPAGVREFLLSVADRVIGDLDPGHRLTDAAEAVAEVMERLAGLADPLEVPPVWREAIARDAIVAYEARRCRPR